MCDGQTCNLPFSTLRWRWSRRPWAAETPHSNDGSQEQICRCTVAPRRSCAQSHGAVTLKPRPQQQQCRSNIVECYIRTNSFDEVAGVGGVSHVYQPRFGWYWEGETSSGGHTISVCNQPSTPTQPLSLIHIWRCRRSYACRSRWSPYH